MTPAQRPAALLATGAGGGIKGTQFAALMKNKPKMIKNRTTLILILVTTRLKRELKRIPVTRIAVKSKAINAAGRLKVRPNGPELPPVIVAGIYFYPTLWITMWTNVLIVDNFHLSASSTTLNAATKRTIYAL